MVIDALEQTEAKERNQEGDRYERPGDDGADSVVCVSSKQTQAHSDECGREDHDNHGVQSPRRAIDVRSVNMVDGGRRADAH